jgi:hypothetical protein
MSESAIPLKYVFLRGSRDPGPYFTPTTLPDLCLLPPNMPPAGTVTSREAAEGTKEAAQPGSSIVCACLCYELTVTVLVS